MTNKTQYDLRQGDARRTQPNLSIFQLMTPRESRRARAVARQAALAVIG